MVEGRQEFDSENENANRIIDNLPDAEGSTHINTSAEYNNRINYGQPEQPYSSSVNPNMDAGIPQSNPHSSEKQKNNVLNRALIGGLALGALGSLAAVLARRKLVQGFNHTASCEEKGAKTVDEGLKNTNQCVEDAVTGIEEGTMPVVTGTSDTSKYTVHSSNPSQNLDIQYQERSNAITQGFSSEQTEKSKNTSTHVIYISPSSTRTKVNSLED
ncbi:hypothetical protein DSM106972_075110 [Dulcicalothrix desertica PCC 7102]|uniref:Uncharacterized protein n=1 Tax=Dulcicalothrix desertica PCC 7102 TaxID=232991 RepID=A0A3S1CFB0_9CYAN|nr:hypothetical protein [Dulcicalothrix desertica]RUT00383.1 hypothetical protein DSM106972_075110 [Dulcicalothrix desertica PCC 7102]TWH42489.1 hypothetical protein CAL7102_06151 [Dulcicalothrix desertica PCC 7102]